jgi:DNA topoisomerase-2
LTSTIINLAQHFVGSNNLNLLVPAGQFGTRAAGGKDHASARYISTFPERVTRKLMHPSDDPLLSYLVDDGLSIEPEWYVPVLPLVLINGADGIGTGK